MSARQAPTVQPEERQARRVSGAEVSLSDSAAYGGLTVRQQHVLALQRTIGNAATRNLIQRDPPADAPRAPRPAVTAADLMNPATIASAAHAAGVDQASPTPTPDAAQPEGNPTESRLIFHITANTHAAPDAGVEHQTTARVAGADHRDRTEIEHHHTSEGHEFTVNVYRVRGAGAGGERTLVGTATLHASEDFRTISPEASGTMQWILPVLRNAAALRPFVQVVMRAAHEEGGGEIESVAHTQFDDAREDTERLRLGRTQIAAGAQVVFNIADSSVTTTLSAEVRHQIFPRVSLVGAAAATGSLSPSAVAGGLEASGGLSVDLGHGMDLGLRAGGRVRGSVPLVPGPADHTDSQPEGFVGLSLTGRIPGS